MPKAKDSNESDNENDNDLENIPANNHSHTSTRTAGLVANDDGIAIDIRDSYEGLLPSPEDMEGYSRINPDFPRQMMEMVQKEQATRLQLLESEEERKKKLLEADISSRSSGQGMLLIYSFGVFALLGFLGGYLGDAKHLAWIGFALLSSHAILPAIGGVKNYWKAKKQKKG